jgi:hypothetical protein
MPAPRPGVDGDTLYRNALLTVCKSDKPRDGGAAIGVFCDWVQEHLTAAGSLFFYDYAGTGFILFVGTADANQVEIGGVDFSTDTVCSWKTTPTADPRETLTSALRWFWE